MLRKIRENLLGMTLVLLMTGSAFAEEGLRQVAVPLPADLKPFKNIRVLVMKQRPQLRLNSSVPCKILDARGEVLWEGPKMQDLLLRASPGGIQLGTEKNFFDPLLIKTTGRGLRMDNKAIYGENILVRQDGAGNLDAIAELPLDDYLKGVIPFEANPLWTLEALKAQVVAARSYAFFKMIDRANEPYDVSSEVFSQVYAGKHIENPKTNQAVDETHGEILTYKNKVFPGYFHSTCGGRTARADRVWKVKSIEPLNGVECKFCRNSPHYRWEASFTPQEIREKMTKKGGIPVQEVKGIKLEKIDESGRAHSIIIKSTWIDKVVDADAFRLWMGPEKLKSNLITRVSATDGKFVFKGRGWGHGAGMCQYGMKYLGELGYGYREILGYYYPGAQVVGLDESRA